MNAELAPSGNAPVTRLRGVGPSVAEKLAKLNIRSVEDLLFHLPRQYEDRTRITPIGALKPGWTASVEGVVELTEVAFRGRRMLLTRISDGTGALTLRFFHFNAAQQTMLARGARLRCYGEARQGKVTLEMVHPEYKILGAEDLKPQPPALTPIYPATEGIQQMKLRALTDQALSWMAHGNTALEELLPPEVLGTQMPPLAEALHYVHRPPPDAPLDLLMDGSHPAQQRLAFEELLAHHLSLRRIRLAEDKTHAAPLACAGKLAAQFRAALPFKLTNAQERVAAEVAKDVARAHPMMRLVQGDVGSGKTVVAALAALGCIEAGHQAALMAPTELLAEQHFRNFTHWLTPLGIEPAWLSGRSRPAERAVAVAKLAAGTTRLAIGTHALFQEDVRFQDLALVIIDEQHRFGVHQRLALREKGTTGGLHPHQLIMTATPIPRTLAMTAYADLDVSAIDELPPSRKPVKTVALSESKRAEVVMRVDQVCREGRQVYWVCPLIEESELLQAQAAEDTAKALAQALPDLKVGLLHGRQKPKIRDAIMARFKDGSLNLLVATTVVEVGVDVPNASLMIIENAERLGLSQLHQLRGRVGRGAAESSCVLLYKPPLGSGARARLDVMRATNDGFEIARKDLELRGPGELLGTRQAGEINLRIADLLRDAPLIPKVQEAATLLLERYPQRVSAILRRWLGETDRYSRA
ncbi:MAG TPA: ATP-dependent DNA helicase RecG [Gammaproteobacteria bacterium]|nr:ATP-dependent DNA helicase RecG [Gammaproteobacteria bacterium]